MAVQLNAAVLFFSAADWLSRLNHTQPLSGFCIQDNTCFPRSFCNEQRGDVSKAGVPGFVHAVCRKKLNEMSRSAPQRHEQYEHFQHDLVASGVCQAEVFAGNNPKFGRVRKPSGGAGNSQNMTSRAAVEVGTFSEDVEMFELFWCRI